MWLQSLKLLAWASGQPEGPPDRRLCVKERSLWRAAVGVLSCALLLGPAVLGRRAPERQGPGEQSLAPGGCASGPAPPQCPFWESDGLAENTGLPV